jgi:hypothetical protein
VGQKRKFVHLAYLDDSNIKRKKPKWQVMSGVIIEDKIFKLTEVGVAIVPELLMPAERMSQFEEFHACELYGGHGVFDGIDQDLRFEAIERLLATIKFAEIPIVYGAVDLTRLHSEFYASADPADICFRICLEGIDFWAEEDINSKLHAKLGDNIENYKLENVTPHVVNGLLEELVIVIVDECDKKVRDTLQQSYRGLRPPRNVARDKPFSHFHDDMYFGDSRYSIGIQLADLCSYFIARHLDGDNETESFYEMIHPHIVYSKIRPPIPTEEADRTHAPKEITDGK